MVERFNSDVKTQSLKAVVVEDDDYRKLFFAMRRKCRVMYMPAGKNIPLPKPEDMERDLNEIDQYRRHIKRRNSETQDKRRALEKAPVAKVE